MELQLIIGGLWLQEVGGGVVIAAVIGWFIWPMGRGRRKIRDLKSRKVTKAWWFGRRRRKAPPGPFIKS